MRERLGRECLYMPSCRPGLYVTPHQFCEPGGRILMSPVNDDVTLFVVLGRGLRRLLDQTPGLPLEPRRRTALWTVPVAVTPRQAVTTSCD